MDTFICSKCGSHLYDEKLAETGVYVCIEPDSSNVMGKCCTVHCLCKTCNKIYPENNFGKHGDVYECKTCGSLNWPYTDRQREHENLMKKISSLNSGLNGFLSRNKDIFG